MGDRLHEALVLDLVDAVRGDATEKDVLARRHADVGDRSVGRQLAQHRAQADPVAVDDLA